MHLLKLHRKSKNHHKGALSPLRWFWWWLFGALHDLVEGDVYGMLGRNPVDLQEQRGHRDGDIAEHKDREGKQVSHQTPLLRAVNMLVLKDSREQRQDKNV